jgi:hypothetical protein
MRLSTLHRCSNDCQIHTLFRDETMNMGVSRAYHQHVPWLYIRQAITSQNRSRPPTLPVYANAVSCATVPRYG